MGPGVKPRTRRLPVWDCAWNKSGFPGSVPGFGFPAPVPHPRDVPPGPTAGSYYTHYQPIGYEVGTFPDSDYRTLYSGVQLRVAAKPKGWKTFDHLAPLIMDYADLSYADAIDVLIKPECQELQRVLMRNHGSLFRKVYVNQKTMAKWASAFELPRQQEYAGSIIADSATRAHFDAFVKREWTALKDYGLKPRIIHAVTRENGWVQPRAGPYLNVLSKRLANETHPIVRAAGSRSGEEVGAMFTADLDGLGIEHVPVDFTELDELDDESGEDTWIDWAWKVMEKLRAKVVKVHGSRFAAAEPTVADTQTPDWPDWMVFSEEDGENYDASVPPYYLEWLGRKYAECGMHKGAARWLGKAGRFTVRVDPAKVPPGWPRRYKGRGMASGRPDTYFANTLLNMGIWETAVERFQVIHGRLPVLKVYISSDDVFAFGSKRDLSEIRRLRPNVGVSFSCNESTHPARASFLGGWFLPTVDGFVLTPLPARQLAKCAASIACDSLGNWLSGATVALAADPVAGPFVRDLARQVPGSYGVTRTNPDWSAAPTSTHLPCNAGFDWWEERYGTVDLATVPDDWVSRDTGHQDVGWSAAYDLKWLHFL